MYSSLCFLYPLKNVKTLFSLRAVQEEAKGCCLLTPVCHQLLEERNSTGSRAGSQSNSSDYFNETLQSEIDLIL